jgi:hypothetical protein
MLAFSRVPGNAFSFWIRQSLRWSRGAPTLPHEPKENLFAYLAADGADGNPSPETPAGAGAAATAEKHERELRSRYRLAPLAEASTRALYRKNLYLLDILEQACEGLPIPALKAGPDEVADATGIHAGANVECGGGTLTALDVGSQDWHYVFALERWLRYANASDGRMVALKGVEVDGYGIYPDFRSRKDYAQAYLAQSGNADVTYEVGDFLKTCGGGYDVMTWFYPFMTRHHLLLWGLPLRFFRPVGLLEKAVALIKPGGWMLVFTHTLREHALFLELGKAVPGFELAREGRVKSRLVDFYAEVADRRYSVWRRI